MRLALPVWLGAGEALAQMAAQPEGLATLQEMYKSWPFFMGLVRAASTALATLTLATPTGLTTPLPSPHRRGCVLAQVSGGEVKGQNSNQTQCHTWGGLNG